MIVGGSFFDVLPHHVFSLPGYFLLYFILLQSPTQLGYLKYLGIPILTGLRVCPTTTSIESKTFRATSASLHPIDTKDSEIP